MATKDSPASNNVPATTNTFNKSMVKDVNETYSAEGAWTHARNAVNNAHDGQLGVLGNEPANLHMLDLPYTVIGCIHITDDEWCIFSTDDKDSEIGLFDESKSSYTKVVNDPSLNFNRDNLITGVARSRFDCTRAVYFADGNNPDRYIDLNNVPYITEKVKVDGCFIDRPTAALDAEKLRMAPFMSTPLLELKKSNASGLLPNGTYQVAVAYSINNIKVSNYFTCNEIQGIWDHNNVAGALEINIKSIDKDFDEFELVIIQFANGQYNTRRIGYFSTNLEKIFIDTIDPTLSVVPFEEISVRTPAYETSDAMYSVNNYLLKVGIREKFLFNYQKLASKIRTKWVAVQYPGDYYVKGGNNTSYLRDEQYAFFIRWIYNTGEKSASYHIPGRAAVAGELDFVSSTDAIEIETGDLVQRWQVNNTATITSLDRETLVDGGLVLAKGQMGYWESEYQYPDNKPEIWGELCGKKIRHHKFPDNTLHEYTNHYLNNGDHIVIMGVQFDNIAVPVDNAGKPIDSIVGYEILRGSREGNKTIVAKGLLNNLREYDIPGQRTVKGLYQNYPFNDLRKDTYLVNKKSLLEKGGVDGGSDAFCLTGYKKNMFSFHSPETTFNKPFLAINELKVYGEIHGTATGYFETPYKHPTMKLASDFSSVITKVLAAAKTIANIVGAVAGADSTLMLQATEDLPLSQSLITPHRAEALSGVFIGLSSGYFGTTGAPGADQVASAKRTFGNTAITVANIAMTVAMAVVNTQVLSAQLYRIVLGLIPRRQYAAQYNAYGKYTNFIPAQANNLRRRVINSIYVDGNLQTFSPQYRINNLYRNNFVAVELSKDLLDPRTTDNSRITMGDKNLSLNQDVDTTISAYYGAIKNPLSAQYGFIESVRQLPISTDMLSVDPKSTAKYTSTVHFGGDVYINRFTEKNSMFFFNQWMIDQPDEFAFDYRMGVNVAYPRYWVDSTSNHYTFLSLASNFRRLDKRDSALFHIKEGYFYLFNSGVRDFWVESEINLAYRDWEDVPGKRHYDPHRYRDLQEMFRSDLIKSSNYYKYDYSLSVSKLYNNFINWGSTLPTDYDPKVAETCLVYNAKRLMYSLPQEREQKKDLWRVFLPLNYRDFRSKITAIKPVNRTGAVVMFDKESPIEFVGVDTLQTGAGTKIIIGDGGLFENQPLQNMINAEKSYQYGSCQHKYSVCSTPQGLFWISQDQGKIFQHAGQIKEISREGNKWWFAKHLPSKLLQEFPNYDLTDNPITGIGTQTVYDNTNEIIYFSKKDWALNPEYKGKLSYIGGNLFMFGGHRFELGDPIFFSNASFTVSYDLKTNAWISFHDWHPDFVIPGKRHFMSIKNKGIWMHNVRTDLYTNFYGKNYPFEVEFISSTGQQVTTVRNIEYMLEAYHYSNEGQDKHHVLDYNFDQAVVYNSEQISGLLNLKLKPKNNPLEAMIYPKVNSNGIDILYSKEENKYRFNQFWDITKQREEFTMRPVEFRETMFNTLPTGYEFNINPRYIDYQKATLERKKFRHYVNRVFLRKNASGPVKMNIKIVNTKINPSAR
jgi:hypothetical protein